MMDWAVRTRNASQNVLPPFQQSAGGGKVLNEFTIRGDATYVVLPNRSSDSSDTETVAIDTADLQKMDGATDKYWQYDAPGDFPPGVYLPQHEDRVAGLARLLLNAPRGTWRMFRDGDPLNCRRSNLALLKRHPLQQDWLWNAPLPQGFTEVRRSENYIMVSAERGADVKLMWQYLLERWQFCRSHHISLSIPRIHAMQTSWLHRLTVIIKEENQCYSFDIGDDGARENQRYDVRETEAVAA